MSPPRDGNSHKKFNLSKMSDSEVEALMNSIEIDDDDTFEDIDDSIEDPDYHADKLEPEDDAMINDCLQLLDSSALVNAVNLSMNVSNFTEEIVANECQIVGSEVEVVTKTQFKPMKRARSPLPSIEVSGPQLNPSNGGFTGSDLSDINKDSDEFKKIMWRQKNMQLHINEVAFRGKTDLPSEVQNLQTPLNFFSYFFTDELIELICMETNRAAIVENVNTKFKVDKHVIRRYIGVLIFMSIFRYPNIEAHWSEYGFQNIPDCMSKNNFEQIKKYLSFNDESQRIEKGHAGYDPIFRIRKVADHLNERFDSIPKNARLCIDEQMAPTKMAHHLRQYLPDKPHPWGVKFFVLCDSTGFAYRFEIYTGASNDDIVVPGTPNIGATGNVVIRLSQTVPNFLNHILYFDNFYTSLPLMVYLRARGIFSLGTIRVNRIPNCKLPNDKSDELKKAPRGYSTEFVGSAYGVDVTTVLWKDTKNVKLCSTYVGTKTFKRSQAELQPSKIARYNRKKKLYEDVDCPQIIREYNAHMGGVDLMDAYMGRNGLHIKTQDMATRIFYHLLDMAITNAFILKRRCNAEKSPTDTENIKDMTMYEFRLNLAKELCASVGKRSAGRPLCNAQPTTSNSVGKRAQHPIASIRFDQTNHYPQWGSKKSCKLCKKSETHTYCTKCNVHLCYSKAKNCFTEYHINK